MPLFPILLLCSYAYAATVPTEVVALGAIYNSTGGENWVCEGTDWNFSGESDPCSDQWKGIICNDTASNCKLFACSVLELVLPQCGLAGVLSNDLTNLQWLQVLNLEGNNIIGYFFIISIYYFYLQCCM